MIVALLIVALLAGAFLVLLEVCIRRSPVASALVLGVTVLTLALDVQAPITSVAGATVVPFDAIATLLAAAAAARLLRASGLRACHGLLLALCGILILSLLRGVAIYGVQPAVNEFRYFFYFFAVTLYATTMPHLSDLLARLTGHWRVAAWALLGLVVLRWLALAAGHTNPGSVLVRAEEGGLRVISAGATILLVYAFFMVLPAWRRHDGDRADRWLAVACMVAVLGLQHRTLLLALGAGVATLVLRDASLRRRLGRRLVVPVAAALAILAWLPTTEVQPQEFGDLNTVEWRVEGWVQLVTGGDPTAVTVLLGEPFGGGYERTVGGTTFDVVPHNYFLETYLRAGVLGLLCLLALYGATLRRLLARRADREGDVPLVLVLTQLVYFLAWSPAAVDGLVAGLAIGRPAARRAELGSAVWPALPNATRTANSPLAAEESP